MSLPQKQRDLLWHLGFAVLWVLIAWAVLSQGARL